MDHSVLCYETGRIKLDIFQSSSAVVGGTSIAHHGGSLLLT